MKKGIIIMLITILLLTLPKITKAETFSIQDNYGIIYYNPAGYDINNTRQNNLYYNSSTANPASIKSRGYIVNNSDGAQGADQGSYLIDIYIYGVGTFYNSYSCTEFNSNFGWQNASDGTWIFSAERSKSKCVAIEKTTYNNYQAIHLLYRWDIVDSNGGGIGGADIQITKYNLFTASSTGSNIGYALGSLIPYDLSIVESFKNGQYMQNIENAIQNQTQTQHQDSLNEQQAINGITNADYNGTLEEPNKSDYDTYQNKEDTLLGNMQSMDLNSVDIAIDANSSNFVWNTMTRLIQSHAMIFSMVISLLSIGVIKLMLSR